MRQYFGTDGSRGPVDGALFTPDFLERLGSALGDYVSEKTGGASLPIVALAHDPRPSGPRIKHALAKGLSGSKVAIYDLGMCPTPAASQAALELSATLVIVITASHNPPRDNGIKLIGPDGGKLSLQEEERIEALLAAKDLSESSIPPIPMHLHEAEDRYIHAISALEDQGGFSEFQVAIDTANGALRQAAPQALRHLGVQVSQIGDSSNGQLINHRCGSEHPEALSGFMRETQHHLGLCFDGDGDRLRVLARDGKPIAGERLLALFTLHLAQTQRLETMKIVTTVHSNRGLDHFLEERGIEVLRSDVGDRAVSALMAEQGAIFGGEASGHFIFRDRCPTGDGLQAAVQLLSLLKRNRGNELAAMAAQIPLFPRVSAEVRTEQKPALDSLAALQSAIAKAERALEDGGRLLVRYSGTEPLLRILVEGPDQGKIERITTEIVTAAKESFSRAVDST